MRKDIFGFPAVLLLVTAPLLADTKEEPVGLILNATGAKLLRADTETPLAARPGDLLFSGDGLRTEAGPASFLFCPSKVLDTLSPSGEVRLDNKQPKVKTGKISETPARACTLPQTLRVAAASQQHYGVSMTRGINRPDVPPTPLEQMPADLKTELAPYEAALVANPKDETALVGEATVFEKRKMPANALQAYDKLRQQWPEAIWVKSKIFDLEQDLSNQAAAATAAATANGKTYALLVGISKFAKPDLSLQFANADASVFAQFLQSPRGGSLPPENVLLLADEKATTAAVRNGFQDFLKRRATKSDTVVILVASHGTVDGKNAFVLTYDSDPQDLQSTALPMDELQSLFEDQVSKVGRVLMFVDVCKSGTIGTIKSNSVNSLVENLKNVDGELLAMMSGRRKELSLEGPQFGGGHGVFSYFVLKGLEGAADDNGDGVVDGNELIRYVASNVPRATEDKQHPTDISPGNVDVKISDIHKPGINLARWPMMEDARTGETLYFAAASPFDSPFQGQATAASDQFSSAIAGDRLLPGQQDNAFDALQRLKGAVDPEAYQQRRNQLQIALENKAQQVLLRYLTGEETPQSQREFLEGASYMEAARSLTQESLFLEGREDFFQGRALLFDKKFPEASQLLEQSVRIDPTGAYGYNALGISYLEQARYTEAIPAFRDAARRAPHWSYPLHNVALAYVETGDYRSAIRAYQEAIRLSPTYSYLPYNLGLVYQRLNRRKDAETSYRKASGLAPNSAEPLNALGTLKAAEGKRSEAEQLYRQSLEKNPSLLPARHNLALLLASQKDGQKQAVALWRENLRLSPDYLPSRLSLAESLVAEGDSAAAITEYRTILQAKPDYVAARIALGELLQKTGNTDQALNELREAARRDAEDPTVFEQIGDLEAARQLNADAKAAYQSALNLKPERAARKRIESKLAKLP